MNVLDVQGLCKHYPGFTLDHVSFSLKPGRITGFIGRNGAGKTTTLGSLLDLVHPDAGDVRFFGLSYREHFHAIRQRIGFVAGGIDHYPRKRLSAITAVTRRFYDGWDDAAYRGYLARFSLDEGKTPEQLSAGMRVKYALALALSHRAELLILDEPTSGLDPVSREDLLELFLQLRDEGTGILFSTHITSDLEKCADDILYLRAGKLMAAASLDDFVARYRLLTLPAGEPVPAGALGVRRSREGATALLPADATAGSGLCAATLEDIMVHLEKEEA